MKKVATCHMACKKAWLFSYEHTYIRKAHGRLGKTSNIKLAAVLPKMPLHNASVFCCLPPPCTIDFVAVSCKRIKRSLRTKISAQPHMSLSEFQLCCLCINRMVGSHRGLHIFGRPTWAIDQNTSKINCSNEIPFLLLPPSPLYPQ